MQNESSILFEKPTFEEFHTYFHHFSEKQAHRVFNDCYPSKRRDGTWPVRNEWWHSRNWLDVLKKKYKYLESILVELNKNQRIGNSYRMSIKNAYETVPLYYQNKYIYAVLKPDFKERLAQELGCSEATIRNYISALVKIGVFKMHRRGANGTFYSIGYWQDYPGEHKNDEWQSKVNYFLSSKTLLKLKHFKVKR